MPTSLVGITNRLLKNRDRQPFFASDLVKPLGFVARKKMSLPIFQRHSLERGVTLIEMLIVMALIALVAGLSYPSVSAGLDTLRLRSTSDAIVGFLNVALARADTRQQAVEILISQQEGTLTARSGDQGFYKRLEIASPIKILSVQPALAADAEAQGQTRRFLMYPGGTVPKIAIEIGNGMGRKRVVSIDPVTGVPQANAK